MEMQDLSDKGSESPGVASSEESHAAAEPKKTCADCGTTKTPLWRGGPAGPKSLCNACGIRSRKKRRDILGISKKATTEDKKAKRSHNHHHNSFNSNSKLGDPLKQRLLDLGRQVLMRRSSMEKQRRKLGEEEQAALLLMALSYGSVYA